MAYTFEERFPSYDNWREEFYLGEIRSILSRAGANHFADNDTGCALCGMRAGDDTLLFEVRGRGAIYVVNNGNCITITALGISREDPLVRAVSSELGGLEAKYESYEEQRRKGLEGVTHTGTENQPTS